ncbi:hypothetical protein PVAP13_5KG745450 [Panicum virgatum]|uniref:Uncharacterized protein n=1 Tax=Panicum virgatum TaxID=38727 RepID=A0A8T0SW50_PANVG|nr:hypothetical protein PVAP13_5KG745450 [Panicum virgatum]
MGKDRGRPWCCTATSWAWSAGHRQPASLHARLPRRVALFHRLLQRRRRITMEAHRLIANLPVSHQFARQDETLDNGPCCLASFSRSPKASYMSIPLLPCPNLSWFWICGLAADLIWA